MKFAVLASLPRSLVAFRGPLIATLRDAGHDVHALAPGISRSSEVVQFLASVGAKHHDIPLDRTGRNPLSDLRAALAIRHHLVRLRPDVVFSYTIKPVVWGTLAAAALGVPRRVAMVTGLGFVFTENASRNPITSLLARRLYRLALARATTVIFQNSDDLNQCIRSGILAADQAAIVVDGSGIDLDAFQPVSPVASPPLRFLLIGRLLGAKGVREYVSAARLVRAKHPQVEFHLVGGEDPGPDAIPQAEVQEWVADHSIIWHGEAQDVRPHLASCHVFVLPSYREGLPRSTQEAMATGRPIITTDVPGCRETVVDGVNGWLIPPRKPAALAAAMERVILDPDLLKSMGDASRRIAEERFDVRSINRQMLDAMGC